MVLLRFHHVQKILQYKDNFATHSDLSVSLSEMHEWMNPSKQLDTPRKVMLNAAYECEVLMQYSTMALIVQTTKNSKQIAHEINPQHGIVPLMKKQVAL